MSAIDTRFKDSFYQPTELEQLRARIAELEANIIECDSMTNVDRKPRPIDEAESAIVRMASEGRAALDRLSELESQPATLALRKCGTDGRSCFVAGWEAAREAAAVMSSGVWHLKSVDGEDYDHVVTDHIAECIRALTPPSDCGYCNLLAPDKHRKLSIVEIAAYHWYLADDDSEDMLSAVFDDMPSDERDWYAESIK